jgi:predicted signal transduction protein with EAL and GGDEF domain
MTQTEREYAIMEANRITSSDGYFYARPQIDSNDRRRVFEAGFERGWEAAINNLDARQPVPKTYQRMNKNRV